MEKPSYCEQVALEPNYRSTVGASLSDAGLGAFVCEKWAVWYDGSGGYTPGYCGKSDPLLFSTKDEAASWINKVPLSSLAHGYHAKKILLHEAP